MSNERACETVALERCPGYFDMGLACWVAYNVQDHKIEKGEMILVNLTTKEECERIMKELQ